MTPPNSSQPTAIVGFGDEWMRRSMQVVFEEKGYNVVKTASGRNAVELAQSGAFDVIMLDERIDALNGVDACSALRDDPLFDHSTPIVIVSSAHSSLASRTRAYAAGCWEYCHQPVDVDALFLKLNTFLRARRELSERARKLFFDSSSGTYTEQGLQQVGEKLVARAVRNHEAMACLALSSEPGPGGDATPRAGQSINFDRLARVLRTSARKSDVLAKKGKNEFSLLAPQTDAAGARLLVARIQEVVNSDRTRNDGWGVGLRVGICAVSDLATANLKLEELGDRATRALSKVVMSNPNEAAIEFDQFERPAG